MLAEEDLTGPSSFTSVYDWLIIKKIYIYIYIYIYIKFGL